MHTCMMRGLISNRNTLFVHIEYKNHTRPCICSCVNNKANVKTKHTELVIIKIKLLARQIYAYVKMRELVSNQNRLNWL